MIYLWKSQLKYDIFTDEDDSSNYIGIYNRAKGPDNAVMNSGLWDGEPWSCSKDDLEFVFDIPILKLLRYDVLENEARFIIVNKLARKILEAFAKDDVQFVPVTVMCRNGTINDYFAINILSRISGIDKQKSKIEWSYENRFMVGFGCGAGEG